MTNAFSYAVFGLKTTYLHQYFRTKYENLDSLLNDLQNAKFFKTLL